jgi:integrase
MHITRVRWGAQGRCVGVSIKEVQALLGHSSPVVTLSVYARSIEGLGRRAVNELARSLLSPERA